MTSLSLQRKNGEGISGGELLRQDTRGRVRTGRERREALLAEYDRSGVSGAQFARLTGIKYQTFIGWLHLRRRGKGTGLPARKRKPVTWMEAEIRAVTADPAPLRVQLPGGAWMDLSSPEQRRGAVLLLRELSAEGGRPC
jgi:hypothetical protein